MAPQIAVLFNLRKMKICLMKRQHNCNSVYWTTCCCSQQCVGVICRIYAIVAHMSVSFIFVLGWGYIVHRLVACGPQYPIVFGVTSSFEYMKELNRDT